jgi:hypothetical protein
MSYIATEFILWVLSIFRMSQQHFHSTGIQLPKKGKGAA